MTNPTSASPSTERTRLLVTAGLMTALISVSALITIPLQPVPLTLQVFFVFLAGLLLPPGWAAASMALYVALGAIGVPVFSNSQAGFGVVAGPTGGYLIGFIVAAAVGAALRALLVRRLTPLAADACAVAVMIAVIYGIGVAQLAMVANLTFAQAFVAGAAPFLALDIAKGAVAVGIAAAVRRAIAR